MSRNPKAPKNSKSPKAAAYMPLPPPPPVSSEEVFEMLPFAKVPYKHQKKSTCQFSDVPDRYKYALRGFRFKEWRGFNKLAARIWTGNNKKEFEGTIVQYMQSHLAFASNRIPQNEDELRSRFDGNILEPMTRMTLSSLTWGFGLRQRLNCEPSSRSPDIRCEYRDTGGSSSQTQNDLNLPILNGELKVPSCLDLGSRVTPEWLEREFHRSNFLDNEILKPFFQALSYGLYTSKGVAFLTNYDVIRFFKINIGGNEILVSPVVKIDQVLNQKHEVPHAAQTLLYMTEIEFPHRNEYSNRLANELLQEGDRQEKENKAKKEEERKRREKKEKEKNSSKGSSSQHKGSSCGDRRGKKHAEGCGEEKFTPVSRVLQECKVIGTVGMGVTGELTECDYNGLKVVVKVGQKMTYKDVRDGFFHVKHEAKMYEVLEKLQGRVIPRMVIAGFERYYTPSAMVLISEKVGMCVVQDNDDKIYVDERVLGEENLMLLEEKGLEGLKTLHEHGVVHYDTAVRNTRVEMRDGKIERVWWVDFGDACEIDEEAKMVWDVEGYRGDFPKGMAIDFDMDVFRGSIRRALKAIELEES